MYAVVAFSARARIWGECWPFIRRLHFFFFFLKVDISVRTLIPLSMPESVHSGSASWVDIGRMSPEELCVS